MKLLLASISLALLASGVGRAAAEDAVITFENASKGVVTGADFFPLGDDGEPIEDNLGGFHDDLAPGATTKIRLAWERCGTVWVRIDLASGKELVITFDTCDDRKVRVID